MRTSSCKTLALLLQLFCITGESELEALAAKAKTLVSGVFTFLNLAFFN